MLAAGSYRINAYHIRLRKVHTTTFINDFVTQLTGYVDILIATSSGKRRDVGTISKAIKPYGFIIIAILCIA
ncbi:hypothetical protein D3C80_1432360 [compost metagenome]